jgi:large subunit ribosomal protein L22
MKVEASLKNVRITPRKVRMVAYSLRGLGVAEALVQLEKQVKKSSLPLAKLIESAVANAENNFGLDRGNLFVADMVVGDGQRLKRWMPRAHGRATPIIRRMAHVRVVLEERVAGASGSRKTKKGTVKTEAPVAERVAEKPEKKVVRKRSSATKRAAVTKVTGAKGAKGAAKKVFQRKAA